MFLSVGVYTLYNLYIYSTVQKLINTRDSTQRNLKIHDTLRSCCCFFAEGMAL